MSGRQVVLLGDEAAALVVVTHGIVKKTQKTPQKEIARAEALMTEYFAKQ